ncbi:gliding motility-associated C-terminal domain-containing protein [Maribacter sp. ANRC-HE7]|uniref:Gliding motility-associated C-terminal domain-containing protein n=1 Tax=Maribacter aquimaris TaxID=2737171 RepID=A0ABR7V563_9FLAO|nr:gliding motility-associated C-terminal domain-containing protein [Maribacter aquimaris]MBD0779933.1 gliding motility-associated C-terminal domain-containing protein [Maribacter aquimaris]
MTSKIYTTITRWTLLLAFAFGLPQLSIAQNLTISSSGDTGTSGTNWSISGNTLNVAASGTANVNASVVVNHLNNIGDLTVVLPGQASQERSLIVSANISYTGAVTRSLIFNIANNITVNSGVSITSATAALNLVFRSGMFPTSPDFGSVVLNGTTIVTKGGHFWLGGGNTNTTWNGLTVGTSDARIWADDVSALSMIGGSLSTEGGNIYLAARSWETGDDNGINYGIRIDDYTISSQAGNISLNGSLTGRYTNGSATSIDAATGNVAITSTTGSITINGTGADQTTNGNSWRSATRITSSGAFSTIISSVSGNIAINGAAQFNATINDKEGVVISGSNTAIVSQTGAIEIKGSNTRESDGQYSNSIRFASTNTTNAIRIGFDGVNAYSGNILIEGNSIYQRSNHAGSGSIAIRSTGTLTIQPSDDAFSYVRSGNAGTLTFDDDWNFGSTLSGFTYGKTTNTANITFASAITIAGSITAYANAITVNQDITSTTAGDITLSANNGFSSGTTTRRNITSANGNIIVNADADANATGTLDIDYLTFNAGTGDLTLRSEIFLWSTASTATKPWINGTGAFTLESNDAAFGQNLETNWIEIDQDANGIGGLTLGKETNTDIITISSVQTIAGPVSIYGSDISVNEDINTSSVSNGDILLKASGNITLAASKTIITENGNVVFWANSDGEASNGSVLIRNQSSITTSGGHFWAGGGSANTTWNGLTVGDGYAVSGTSIQPPVGSAAFSGIYLEEASINTSGGNVYIAGAGTSTHNGILTFAVNDINAGSGTITLKGGTGATTGRGMGVSLHSSSIPNSSLTLTSTSTAASAIDIALNSTSNFGMTVEGTMNIVSSNTGGISLVSLGGGTSTGLRLGLSSDRLGVLNVLGTSGNILVNLGEEGINVQNNISSATIGGKASTAVPSSSSNIQFISDDVTAAGALNFSTSGTLAIEPFGTSFSSTLNTTFLTYTGGISGLTLGKSGNTANTTISGTTTIAGPISVYSGDITVNENLNTTGGALAGDVKLNATGNITLAQNKSITTDGGDVIFKADADANRLGGIRIGTDFSPSTSTAITTNGGDIILSGGTDPLTGFASYDAGLGDAFSDYFYAIGVFGATLNASGTADGGDITIRGNAGNTFNGLIWTTNIGGQYGLNTSVKTNGAGTISITGDMADAPANPTPNSSRNAWAVAIAGTIETENGNLLMVGKSTIARTNARGFSLGGSFQSAMGTITIEDQTLNTNNANYTGPFISGAKIGKGTLTASSSDVIFKADKFAFANNTVVETSGAVTLEPLGDDFASAVSFTTADLSLDAAISGLTIGKSATSADGTTDANVTIAGTTTIAGPISVYSGDITVNENLTSTAANEDILLKGSGNVTLAANKTLQTNAGSILLWSDSDGSDDGRVGLLGNVTTSGGHFYVGGGSASETLNSLTVPTSYALTSTDNTHGVTIVGSTINTDGGNLRIKGQNNSVNTSTAGVMVVNSTITTGEGDLEVYGKRIGDPFKSAGLWLGTTIATGSASGNVTLSSTTGNINLEGISEASNGFSWSHGLAIVCADGDEVTISSTSGNIQLLGNASNAALQSGEALGLLIQIGTNSFAGLTTDGGDITMEGISTDLAITKGLVLRGQDIASSIEIGDSNTGDINVKTGSLETIERATLGVIKFESIGDVVFEGPTGSNFASAFTLSDEYNIVSSATSLRIGKTTNTSNISINQAQTIAGPISVYGGDITISSALTATDDDINLTSTGAVTQSAAITANGLSLNGTGTFTLTNTSNNIVTIAGGNDVTPIGSVNFVDASGNLTIGTVNGEDGFTSTGTVLIETLAGNINLTEPVTSGSSSNSVTGYTGAIVLNAGKSTAAPTSTGGDIVVSSNGAVTAANGISKLYSGSDANSTSLNTLVGGSANNRAPVDLNTVNFTPVLTSGGKFALYRTCETVDAGALSGNQAICIAGTTTFVSDGDAGGTWTSDDTDVATVDVNGEITGVAAGTATITYELTATGGCSNDAATRTVTVNDVDDASFSYSSAAYCADASDPTPTITGLAGGTFSSTTGLSINASTGAIDVSASTPGTYTATYTTAGTCPNSSGVSVTINALDDASFSYSSAAYCVDASDPTPTIAGLAGGTFSSTVGLIINASTGAIDVSTSTPGTYSVTYTTVGTCPNSSGVSVTINALDNASFAYSSSAYFVDASDPTPTITGLAGGAFSSTAGLSFNASTGAIDVSTSTPGTYTVTYTTAGTCPNSSGVSVTVNALADYILSKAALTIDEAAGTGSFTVVLDAQPTSDVVLDISSDDTNEATVSLAQLTFTSANWDTAQTITVTGVDDAIDRNDSATITLTVNDAGSDDTFDDLTDQTVAIKLTDDDVDTDGDGVLDPSDNCVSVSNADQLDTDFDGQGNVCDTDDDNDGTLDTDDDFPLDDSEDTDTDGDGVGDNVDATDNRLDSDGDGVPDADDAFPNNPDESVDTDNDGIGDNADADVDGDGTVDNGTDTDGDGINDDNDTNDDRPDSDGDGIPDVEDAFPNDPNESVDTDGDGIGDNADADANGDGIVDNGTDTDGDGINDANDTDDDRPDSDGDGVPDEEDAFPNDPDESVDLDGDGIGANADQNDNDTNIGLERSIIAAQAFTPNGDGINDTWFIQGIENHQNAMVTVYNRYGHEVFKAVGYRNDWTGRYGSKSENLPAGSYYYVIDFRNGSTPMDGWIFINY